MSDEPPPTTVDARPTKRFFVRMLVRDIELVPAIIDLVDNCVDGAKRLVADRAAAQSDDHGETTSAGENNSDVHDARTDDAGAGDAAPTAHAAEVADAESAVANQAATDEQDERPFDGLHVDIDVTPERFRIVDNCGGIPIERAVEYAFRFGRPDDVEPLEGEVGQFGVGMKRALFKLGNHFTVKSTAANSHFALDVPVNIWVQNEHEWTFPLIDAVFDTAQSPEELGTEIVVDELHPSVKREVARERFLSRLSGQIELRHEDALSAGLRIRLNVAPLVARPAELLSSELIRPQAVERDLTVGEDTVHMRLYAGFVRLRDEDADTDNPEEFRGSSAAGWYLSCNGRMLLWANRSVLTGWGEEVAAYHPQYRRFRGYVELTGSSAAMPWNTAKTTIDEDHELWAPIRKEMVDALRSAQGVMNRLKVERERNAEDERPVTKALETARPTRLAKLERSSKIAVPKPPPKTAPKAKTIRYQVPVGHFDAVAASVKTTKGPEIGRETFYYYMRREIES